MFIVMKNVIPPRLLSLLMMSPDMDGALAVLSLIEWSVII